MTEPLDDSSHVIADSAVAAFIGRLSDQQKMLVVLKSKLYEGRWDSMLDDLKNRLAGKPYIFKLVNRIKDDIASIQELQAFEQEHKIDLADFVELGG